MIRQCGDVYQKRNKLDAGFAGIFEEVHSVEVREEGLDQILSRSSVALDEISLPTATHHPLLEPVRRLVEHLEPRHALRLAAGDLLRERADALLELEAERAVQALALVRSHDDGLARLEDALVRGGARRARAPREQHAERSLDVVEVRVQLDRRPVLAFADLVR
jgi:hypothetical protein